MKMIFGKQMIIGLVVSLAGIGIGSWHITERSDAYNRWKKLLARACMYVGICVSCLY